MKNQEVRFMAVLKGESKGKAFYEYGGDFDDLPKSKAQVETDMEGGSYIRTQFEIVEITQEEAEEFVTTHHPLV